MAVTTIPHCPLCGQDVNTYTQPALHPNAIPRIYGECLNETCRAYGVTLLIEDVLALTLESVQRFPDRRL